MNFLVGYVAKNWNTNAILRLSIIGFIIALAGSSVNTVWPLYLKDFLKEDKIIGFFSSAITLIYFALYFFLTPVLERYQKTRLFYISIWGVVAVWTIYYFNENIYMLIAITLISIIFFILDSTALGMIFRYQSSLDEIGHIEALRYTLMNVGWLIGPLIGGFVSEKFGVRPVFLVAVAFLLIVPFIFTRSGYKDKISEKSEFNIFSMIKGYFKDIDRVKHYVVSSGISAWWGMIYIFGPLFVIKNDMHNLWVGIFLFLVCIPLVLLEYPLGKKVNKLGYKSFFALGYLTIALFSLAAFLATKSTTVLLLLAAASIGAAFIEPTREAYYFRITEEKKTERYYGPYLTSAYLGNSLGTFIGGLTLSFLPFEYIFLVFSILMAFFGLTSLLVTSSPT